MDARRCVVASSAVLPRPPSPIQILPTLDPLGCLACAGTEGQTTKADFDAHFGKFYRIQQIIVTRRDEAGGNVLEVDLLKELAAMQAAITNTTATRPGGRVVTLDDVCFRPIAEKTCVIATPLDYWGVNSGPFTSFEANLEANNCDPNSLRFRSFCGTPLGYSASEIAAKDALGAGLIQKNLLGGLTPDRARTAVDPTIPRILAAEAALVSWLLSWPSADRLDDALAWEAQFIERARALEEAQERAALEGASVREATTGVTVSGRLRLAYSSERSIEDEITRESSGDVKLVIISYVVVFVYTAIVLAGTHFSWARMGLGFIGVLLVVLALAAGLGLSAAIGLFFVPMTLQVIPFLIVGIGVVRLGSARASVRGTAASVYEVECERWSEGVKRMEGDTIDSTPSSSPRSSPSFFFFFFFLLLIFVRNASSDGRTTSSCL